MTTEDTIYRPGLEGIIAGETAISTITGGLRYRGYAIEDLAEHAGFEEVAYLILNGDLPTSQQLAAFESRLRDAMQLPQPLVSALQQIPRETLPMDALRSAASLLGHWEPEAADNGHDANLRKSERLLAQLPVALAVFHRLRSGNPPPSPDPRLSFAGNVLKMLTGDAPDELATRAMNVTLILYAEHEFNASTFTARVVASTLADLHSAITAAIGALKGPLHGGANERVMDVLSEVGSPQRAQSWVREALANKVRIMGFGHRVYKTGDPRAKYLKTLSRELAERTGQTNLEETAEVIESVVVSEKGLPPNLDWPSARVYHYLGLPIDLYTPLFVLSRVVGWSAHVIEQHDHNRLIRPRANYTGPDLRPYVPIEQR